MLIKSLQGVRHKAVNPSMHICSFEVDRGRSRKGKEEKMRKRRRRRERYKPPVRPDQA